MRFLRKVEQSLAAKQVGKLYHFISPEKLIKALKLNRMPPNTGSQPMRQSQRYLHYVNDRGESVFQGVSTTRNPNWKPNETYKHGYWDLIRLTLDGNKISQKYKIKSYNDFWKNEKQKTDDFYDQREERIVTDKQGVKDFLQYVLQVDVLEDAVEEFQKLGIESLLKGLPVNVVKDFSKKKAL